MIGEIRNLVGNARLRQAIEKFSRMVGEDSDMNTNLTLLAGRLSSIDRERNSGIASNAEYNQSISKITHSYII